MIKIKEAIIQIVKVVLGKVLKEMGKVLEEMEQKKRIKVVVDINIIQ